MKVAVIGGGISGLSIAQLLKENNEVKVFEKENRPGGLIKCERVEGNLYHPVGGHVFNSKRQDVLDWFWNFFDREQEFTKATRNAVISMADGLKVGYPIENHMYQFPKDTVQSFIKDMLAIAGTDRPEPTNFEEFLRGRFGETLYQLYFKPYNEKIWRKDLKKVPLTWLAGKLPMPTVEEILENNISKAEETQMVHSSFYYAKQNGSQFLVDRLAEGLDISYNSSIEKLSHEQGKWIINKESFDKVIFCGNIKALPTILKDSLVDITPHVKDIEALEYHGTTSVLCTIDPNHYSWMYLPDPGHLSHRIICTGNFATSNNAEGVLSATVEFTDKIPKEEILENLKKLPFTPKYITHRYTEFTYPIQDAKTRETIKAVKEVLKQNNLYLLGRFAEWEYYNMDAAVGAALDLIKRLI